MRACRLHVAGGSGTGTTTLGRALADAWSVPHADADDFFWEPTAPAFLVKRPIPARLSLMEAVFVPRDAWVLSGSVMGWGDPLVDSFDAVVLLTLDASTRLERLRTREWTRLGPAIASGGRREAAHLSFMEWAAGYDDPDFDGRSRTHHERWLSRLACPVLRLDSAASPAALAARVQAWKPGS